MKKTQLKIHIWPDQILKLKCKEVSRVDDQIRILLDQMQALMVKQNGIGLAANQAGLDLRLVVIQVKGKTVKLVNPKITKKQGVIKPFMAAMRKAKGKVQQTSESISQKIDDIISARYVTPKSQERIKAQRIYAESPAGQKRIREIKKKVQKRVLQIKLMR